MAQQLPLHDHEAHCVSVRDCTKQLMRAGRKYRKYIPDVSSKTNTTASVTRARAPSAEEG